MSALTSKAPAPGLGGSFHVRQIAEDGKPFVRKLAALATVDHFFEGLSAAEDAAGAQIVDRNAGRFVLRWQDSQVGFIGSNREAYDRLVFSTAAGQEQIVRHARDDGGYSKSEAIFLSVAGTTGTALADRYEDQFLLFPRLGDNGALLPCGLLQTFFTLPCAVARVVAIRLPGRNLVRGVDFWHRPDGLLIFREHPAVLFPSREICCINATAPPKFSIFSYPCGLDADVAATAAAHVLRYAKRAPSMLNFRNAIAAAAGVTVVESDCQVLAAHPLPEGGRVYETSAGPLRANYPHQPLGLGDLIDAGSIIGEELVQVYHGERTSRWHRRADWTNGLPLDSVCPVKGLTIPDAENRVYVTDDAGNVPLVRFRVDGAELDVAKFFQHLDHVSSVSGQGLADVLSLSSEGDSVIVNLLDLFFDQWLGECSAVVQLRLKSCSALFRARALEFASRVRPADVNLIILDL